MGPLPTESLGDADEQIRPCPLVAIQSSARGALDFADQPAKVTNRLTVCLVDEPEVTT